MDITTRLVTIYPKLSKGRKRIVDYILNNKEDAAFLTAAELAKKSDISESVVVRFATSLDYSGYKEMQVALAEELKKSLIVIEKFEDFIGNVEDVESVYSKVITTETANLNKTINSIDKVSIENLVNKIISAERVGVFAIRGGTSVALVLQLFLNQILGKVHLLTTSYLDMYDQIKDWGENDLVISIGFLEEIKFRNDVIDYAILKGCKIGTITDNRSNHIARNADYVILTEVKSPFISYTAPMLIVSIIEALVIKKIEEKGESLESMKEIGKIISKL